MVLARPVRQNAVAFAADDGPVPSSSLKGNRGATGKLRPDDGTVPSDSLTRNRGSGGTLRPDDGLVPSSSSKGNRRGSGPLRPDDPPSDSVSDFRGRLRPVPGPA
ncbi:uncharacterized protein SPPG_01109 [Spizellomyces punctatus DAOM BR117]|uniref:Uncharacterized protein n=1 Tax=Spizellomyces punctatus (strain DAOM BR117) TaxID=645134 RepID=A0A0L0HRW5_SPIPD|nr:uncharacterized protein SPPG_01109 [Spizellomyces punctatus DAOM BR117]KND03635.1 hypothetical protein SPPG_01109 [Spizellomyces punctatus DAOM BR117]|eukprot:XP_016611674.1 hypothetical protein SPPG_01109 [Spizellomyces punctatus DAOM BR117]